jgi:hypothetical protein
MNKKIKDLTGKKFGRLTVIKENGRTNGKRKLVVWLCRCECGNYVNRTAKALTTSKNSGCDNCKFIREDLTGKRYGKIQVISMKGHEKGSIIWNCICDCGKELEINTGRLNSGSIKSCGCSKKERMIKQNTIHGKANTRLYEIWIGMKKRCYNPNCHAYKNYGGRGITICQEWLDDFMNFYNWAMENGYRDDLSIDRIDVNGNYCPENCRWSTESEQALNKRETVYYEMFGLKKPLSEWCKCAQTKYIRAYQRLRNGNNPFDKEETEKIKNYLESVGNLYEL